MEHAEKLEQEKINVCMIY